MTDDDIKKLIIDGKQIIFSDPEERKRLFIEQWRVKTLFAEAYKKYKQQKQRLKLEGET